MGSEKKVSNMFCLKPLDPMLLYLLQLSFMGYIMMPQVSNFTHPRSHKFTLKYIEKSPTKL